MSIICVVVSHAPSANAQDFRILTFAPVAASQMSRVSCNFRTSTIEVKNMVTSSAYAITAVFACPLPIWMPLSFLSSVWINRFRHSTNSYMLSGHPCLMELCIEIRLDLNPFICTSDAALLYIPIMRCRNRSVNPWACNIASRYECKILSNAALKSMDTMHNGVFVTSAWATASLTVTTTSNAEFPCIP